MLDYFDETSSEGGELPQFIEGRGKMVQLIRETGPENHTCTVNYGKPAKTTHHTPDYKSRHIVRSRYKSP
jgi:hypothetical protein